MITFRQGNLLEADVDAVVNTVNTVGVMGKGIALMFKERYPDNFAAYEAACKAGAIHIGHMFVTDTGELSGPRWVINFPTKQHWRHPSRLEWIADGLEDLALVVREKRIRSLALPLLGCGNGGLDLPSCPMLKSSLTSLRLNTRTWQSAKESRSSPSPASWWQKPSASIGSWVSNARCWRSRS
jgi:O-acetyl-ADP-ribose deacetylase (regulator of RNase III)